ncbi:hypothetical protein HMPREF9419_0619 [Prevotella nigrescens ATCC 33563]|nr:hypothetical protein HMPREF9419_0619 [Prevotella nigrescens ATCC 33563]
MIVSLQTNGCRDNRNSRTVGKCYGQQDTNLVFSTFLLRDSN